MKTTIKNAVLNIDFFIYILFLVSLCINIVLRTTYIYKNNAPISYIIDVKKHRDEQMMNKFKEIEQHKTDSLISNMMAFVIRENVSLALAKEIINRDTFYKTNNNKLKLYVDYTKAVSYGTLTVNGIALPYFVVKNDNDSVIIKNVNVKFE